MALYDRFTGTRDAFTVTPDGFTEDLNAFTGTRDAFTDPHDGFTADRGGFTARRDGLTSGSNAPVRAAGGWMADLRRSGAARLAEKKRGMTHRGLRRSPYLSGARGGPAARGCPLSHQPAPAMEPSENPGRARAYGQLDYRRRLAVMTSALNNLRTIDDLRTRMARRGYDDARVSEGEALAAAVRQAIGRRVSTRGTGLEATAEQGAALTGIRRALNALDRLARRAFRDDPATLAALGLDRRRPSATVPLIEHARAYATEVAVPPRWTRMEKKGAIQEDLDALTDAVAAADAELKDQDTGAAGAQTASARRRRASANADDWMGDMHAAARVEFADEPQMLEYLGVIVRD